MDYRPGLFCGDASLHIVIHFINSSSECDEDENVGGWAGHPVVTQVFILIFISLISKMKVTRMKM